MSFDGFFRDLNTGKKSQREQNILCSCNAKGIKGRVVNEGQKFKFEGNCSKKKACFKINFDCKTNLSSEPEIISKKSRKGKGGIRPTLDQFLGLAQT
ncbi:MAG: hypothetical protein ACW97X_08995, partial [Candidatus Hodarchaeales archaeon]